MWNLLKKIVDIFFSEKKPKKLLKKSNHIPIKNVKVIEFNNQAIINNQVIKKNVKVLEKELKTNNDINTFEKKHIENVIEKICVNLVYLEMLLMMLNDKPQYQKYYEKVDEMHMQSKGNIKILHRIPMKAPYFPNTFKMVVKHTMYIDKLRKSSSNGF